VYEYDTQTGFAHRPRQCCPVAYMKFVSKSRVCIPCYPPPLVLRHPVSPSATSCRPASDAPPSCPRQLPRTMASASGVASFGGNPVISSMLPRLPVTSLPSSANRLPSTANPYLFNMLTTEPTSNVVPTSGYLSATTSYSTTLYRASVPTYSQSFASHCRPAANSVSTAYPAMPPLIRCHSAAADRLPVPTSVPNLRRSGVVNPAAAAPAVHGVPTTLAFQTNVVPAARPPTGCHDALPTTTIAHQTAIPSSCRPTTTPSSTISATNFSALMERTGSEFGSLLLQYRDLIVSVIRLSSRAIRDALATIDPARRDQYSGALPCIGEAWTRLQTATGLIVRVRRQLNVYMQFLRHLDAGAVDVNCIDVATLERSARCVRDCGKQILAIYDQLQRWKLPDYLTGRPSGGVLAACAAGMADQILRFSDDFFHLLATVESTVMLTVPSQTQLAPAAVEETFDDAAPVQQRPLHNLVYDPNQFTPEPVDEFRLTPGYDEQQRITDRLNEDVDHLMMASDESQRLLWHSTSLQSDTTTTSTIQPNDRWTVCPPVLFSDNSSSMTSITGDPQMEQADPVVYPVLVIAPDGTEDYSKTPSSEVETKFSCTMSTDNRQQRVRRTDLGTIDLVRVFDDNYGSKLFPTETAAPDPLPANVDDVSVVPAANCASDSNLGLDLFVQFSFPPGNQPTPLTEGSGYNNEEVSAVRSECNAVTPSLATVTGKAPTATHFDVKEFESVLNYDLEGQNQLSVMLPAAFYLGEHSDIKTDQAAASDSNVIDLCSGPDEETNERHLSSGLLDVRWPMLNRDHVDNDAEANIRFSLPSEYDVTRESNADAQHQPEIQKVERYDPVVDVTSNNDDKEGVILLRERRVPAPVVVDHDEGVCCQIVDVFSLGPEADDAIESGAVDVIGPYPSADDDCWPGKVASDAADGSRETKFVDQELISASCVSDLSSVDINKLNNGLRRIIDDVQKERDSSVLQHQCRLTTANSQTNNNVVENGSSLPSVCPENVCRQRRWRPRKMTQRFRSFLASKLDGNPHDKRLKRRRSESPSTESSSDGLSSLPSCEPSLETHDLVKSPNRHVDNLKRKRPQDLSNDSETDSENSMPSVKRKREGSSPGRRLHDSTVMSSSKNCMQTTCNEKSTLHRSAVDLKTTNSNSGNVDNYSGNSSRKISVDIDQDRDPVSLGRCDSEARSYPTDHLKNHSLPSVNPQKVTGTADDANISVKKKRGRPPGRRHLHPNTVASSSDVLSTNCHHRTDSKVIPTNALPKVHTNKTNDMKLCLKLGRSLPASSENCTKNTPAEELTSHCTLAVLKTNNGDKGNAGLTCNADIQQEKNPDSLERRDSACYLTGHVTNHSSPSLNPQEVAGTVDDAVPVKRKRGRPPGRRLHSNSGTSLSTVDTVKQCHKTESRKVAKPRKPEVHTNKEANRELGLTLETINPFGHIFDRKPDAASTSEHPNKQARASLMIWQSGSVVNLAPPPSVNDARYSAATAPANDGKVGLGGEWKPAVSKKSLEMQPAPKAAAAVDSHVGWKQTTSGADVRYDQTTSMSMENGRHSSVACDEIEEEWSDVEPMSPCRQTQPALEQRPTVKVDLRVFEDISEDEGSQDRDEPGRLLVDLDRARQDCVEKSSDDLTDSSAWTIGRCDSHAGARTLQRNTILSDTVDAETSKITTVVANSLQGDNENRQPVLSSSECAKGDAAVTPDVQLAETRVASDPSDSCERRSVRPNYNIEKSPGTKLKIHRTSTEDSKTSSERKRCSKNRHSKSRSPLRSTGSGRAQYFMAQWASAPVKDAQLVADTWKRRLRTTEANIMSEMRRQDKAIVQSDHRLEESQRKQVCRDYLLTYRPAAVRYCQEILGWRKLND